MFLLRYFQLVLVIIHVATAMFTKRALPDRGSDDPTVRMRNNLVDLFLSNDISSARAQSLFDDADQCKIGGFRKLAKIGNRGKTMGNCARDARQLLIKDKKWPPLYVFRCRVYSPKLQQEVLALVPMLLPHELLGAIAKKNETASLTQTGGLCATTLKHLESARIELQDANLIPIGLWGDGCPCNWDRTQSLEVFSLSLPGIPEWEHMRIPLAAVLKKHVVTHNTFDDMLAVFAWSMRCLATGVYPSSRHDGSAFSKRDPFRKKKSMKEIGVKAVLAEVRGDWKMYKECFRLPGWNTLSGICWKCAATPADMRNVSADASWRQHRLSHWDVLSRMASEGKSMSPILGCPCFKTSCFQIDWLHSADLGVACSFLGNLFYMLLDKFDAPSKAGRCAQLFLEMQAWYHRTSATSRLDNLTLSMLKATGKTPKLRAKAAEARTLVGFARELAEAKLCDAAPAELAAKQCAVHLAKCYESLSAQHFDADSLSRNCRLFCLLYVSLETHATQTLPASKLWRVKPKFHMFQEMCEFSEGTIPSLCWTYRDEDFGGYMAKTSRSRGGARTPLSTGNNVLLKYLAKHRIPML
jgi:hypothetical protein